MPTGEQLRQFLVGVVVPVGVASLTTWLFATVHIFNLFGITEGQVSGEIDQVAIWLVTLGIAWLTQHHILAGHYSAGAKAAAAARRSSL